MRTFARWTLLVSLAVTLLVAAAAPALAHGRGTDATNYLSRITDAPAVPGLDWRVYGGDELLWVENLTDDEVIVFGYSRDLREPYLRIGPDGVFENRNSEATYVNRDRFAQVPIPDHVDPEAAPEWVQVSDEPRFAWHDHRIHYMAPGMHPNITDPGERSQLTDWSVPFSLGGQELAVEGTLEWIPGPSPWPWLAIGAVVALPALLGLRTDPVAGRWPGLARPAAAVLGAVVLANVVFLVDDFTAVPLPMTQHLAAAAQTALFMAIGAFGAIRGWQAGDGAFTALGVGAGAMLVGQGFLLWSVLSASQLSTVFPEVLPRAVVGANVLQALAIGAVAYIGTQRLLPDLQARDVEDKPAAAAG